MTMKKCLHPDVVGAHTSNMHTCLTQPQSYHTYTHTTPPPQKNPNTHTHSWVLHTLRAGMAPEVAAREVRLAQAHRQLLPQEEAGWEEVRGAWLVLWESLD